MNITYLIGNGFDRNIGLRTSYSEFLSDYINSVDNTNDSDVIKWFKSLLIADSENWSDAEIAFGSFTSKIRVDYNNSGEVFEICYKDFVERFCLYLESEQNRLDKKCISVDICQEFGAAIKNYRKGLKTVDQNKLIENYSSVGGGETYSIISFNYTDILDKLYETCRQVNLSLGFRDNNKKYNNEYMTPINAHGTLKDNTVIFGVDNEKQIADITVFDNCHRSVKDVFIKKTADETIGELIDKKSDDILQRSNLIYIYGCSMGETDKTWWQRIIQLLKEKNEANVIIYSYKLHKIRNSRTPIDKELQIDKVKTELLKYSDDESDINNDNLRTRIYVTGEDIFASLASSLNSILQTPTNK